MRFTITLSAPSSDDDAQAVRRLRSWLKAAGRCYGLRCVGLRRIVPDDDADAATGQRGSRVASDRDTVGIPTPWPDGEL
ncbi:MAG: hypothetical protein WD049_09795 [Candidatus Paceibacterota bacterium]